MSECRKPIISRDTANIIELWKSLYSNNKIIHFFTYDKSFYNQIPFMDVETLSACLINGYTVMKSKEENVVEYWRTLKPSEQSIVKHTIELLHLKIPPIN